MRKKSSYNLYPFIGIFLIILVVLVSLLYKRNTFFNWSSIRPEIKDTVLVIEKDLNFTRNLQCSEDRKLPVDLVRRNWLMDYSTKLELEKLLSYPNGKIITTAFQGLLLKNDTSIFKHLIGVLNDTTEFVWDEYVGALPVGVYCLKYVLGFDSLFYEGILPPPSYCEIIEYQTKFSQKEIYCIESLFEQIYSGNLNRFEKYYDHR